MTGVRCARYLGNNSWAGMQVQATTASIGCQWPQRELLMVLYDMRILQTCFHVPANAKCCNPAKMRIGCALDQSQGSAYQVSTIRGSQGQPRTCAADGTWQPSGRRTMILLAVPCTLSLNVQVPRLGHSAVAICIDACGIYFLGTLFVCSSPVIPPGSPAGQCAAA